VGGVRGLETRCGGYWDAADCGAMRVHGGPAITYHVNRDDVFSVSCVR
jgi:hypothetical protein